MYIYSVVKDIHWDFMARFACTSASFRAVYALYSCVQITVYAMIANNIASGHIALCILLLDLHVSTT